MDKIRTVFNKKNSNNYEKIRVSLNLYVDDDQLMRSKSRVSGIKSITFNRMHPIMLRKDSNFTKLAILRAHEKVCHQGVESTLNQVRGKYWVIRGRQSVKSVLRKCIICRIIHAKPAIPPSMPLLPEFRIECNYAFENVGLDFIQKTTLCTNVTYYYLLVPLPAEFT